MKVLNQYQNKLYVLIIIFICGFSTSILSQTRFFDKYRNLYDDAAKQNKVVLNDWLEKQIFTLEEKQKYLNEFNFIINYLDSLIYENDAQATESYDDMLNNEIILKFQKYLYYLYYYFPTEYYHYWTDRYEILINDRTRRSSQPFVATLEKYIGRDISFLNWCIIKIPYIFEIHVDEVIPDTVKMHHGIKKLRIIKGKIIKDLKSQKIFKEIKPIEFKSQNGDMFHLLSYNYKYESEFEDMDINYSPISNLKAGSKYIVFISDLLGTKIKKYENPLWISIGLFKNQGLFEIKENKIVDPYNFFRLGENPQLKEVENLFSEKIEKIKLGK